MTPNHSACGKAEAMAGVERQNLADCSRHSLFKRTQRRLIAPGRPQSQKLETNGTKLALIDASQ
jgi:hypothetical protein